MTNLYSDNPESLITRVVDDQGDEALVEPGVVRADHAFLMTTPNGVWLTAGDAERLASRLLSLADDLRKSIAA